MTGSFDWSKDVPFLSLALVFNELNMGAVNLNGTPVTDLRDTFDQIGDQPLDLAPTRLVDLSLDVTVKALKAGALKAATLQAKANERRAPQARGAKRQFLSRHAAGQYRIDANQRTPAETLDLALTNVDAAPLLMDAASFNHVEGKLDMVLAAKTAGANPHAMAAGLTGASRLHFHDGAITGINAPSYVQTIVTYLPGAWKNVTRRIDLTAVDGNFAIDQGTAATKDLHIVSPIIDVTGKGNIGLTDQTFDLRFDPKIVAPTNAPANPNAQANANGQPNRPAPSPLDLGASILVRGSWTNPQISADLSSLLNDPQGAVEKLGTLGQQFMGAGGGTGGSVHQWQTMK